MDILARLPLARLTNSHQLTMSISAALTFISAARKSAVLRKEQKAWYLSRSISFEVMLGGKRCLSESNKSSKISRKEADIFDEKDLPLESEIAGPSVKPRDAL
jgi:hypothetical protein